MEALLVVLLGLLIIGSIIQLISMIFILIHAFRSSVGEGFLCLCVPCYILYYMFAKFEHEKKNLIITGYFVPMVFSVIMQCLTPFLQSNSSYDTYDYSDPYYGY
ncbi:MAG: hypothetical protein AAGF12_19080 [Myxococcota bacterium]